MSRKTVYTGLLVVAIAAVILILASSREGTVDAPKIFAAAQSYTRELREQGLFIPPTVTLQELIDRKLLNPSDVSGFVGAEVLISLTLNPNDPQAVLMRVRFPDGQEIVTMADGSVQSLP